MLPGEPGLVVVTCGMKPEQVRLAAVTGVESYLAEARKYMLDVYDRASPHPY